MKRLSKCIRELGHGNKKVAGFPVLGEQLESRWKSGVLSATMAGSGKLVPPSTEMAMLKRELAKQMQSLELTPEQEAEAQRLAETVALKTREELLQIARLLVSRRDDQLFGDTEFQVRDLVHQIGARAIETAVNERKKGAPKGRA